MVGKEQRLEDSISDLMKEYIFINKYEFMTFRKLFLTTYVLQYKLHFKYVGI